MSGGAYAASHYLITSTKQISPKVLKSLTGKAGPAGPAGPAGAAGAGTAGAAGPQGPAGTNGSNGVKGETGKEGPEGKQGEKGDPGESGFTETLPAGNTETGTWTIQAGKEGNVEASISFAIPLGKPLGEGTATEGVHYVETKGNGTTCPGSAEKPTALPGNLCVYQTVGTAVEEENGIAHGIITRASNTNAYNPDPGTDTSGTLLVLLRHEEESPNAYGTWAVTEK